MVVSKTENVTSAGQFCFLLVRYIISNNLLRQWLEGSKIDKAKGHLEGTHVLVLLGRTCFHFISVLSKNSVPPFTQCQC